MDTVNNLRASASRLLVMALSHAVRNFRLGAINFYTPVRALLPLHEQHGQDEASDMLLLRAESQKSQSSQPSNRSVSAHNSFERYDPPLEEGLSISAYTANAPNSAIQAMDLTGSIKHEELQLYMVANPRGEWRLALQINSRLLSELNDQSKERQILEKKRDSLAQLEERRQHVENAIYLISGSNDSPPSDINEYNATRLEALRSKICQIDEIEGRLRRRIEISQSNVKASSSFIYAELEAVFLEQDLIRQVDLSNEDDLMELDADEQPAVAPDQSHFRPEPIRTPEQIEELERQAARDECQMLEVELINAERDMDWKEMRYQADYNDYLQCVEEGITDWTKSDFDRKLLLKEQAYTQRLIQLEIAFDAAVERAEALGAWDNGEDQSSYYGYSQCASQSLVANQTVQEHEQTQADIDSTHRILNWVASIGRDPALHNEVSSFDSSSDCMQEDTDDVQISDSLSVIAEDTTWRRKIQKYHAQCESLRQSMMELQ